MKKDKNILITGATGFIGSYLCKELTKKGYVVFGLASSGRTDSIKTLLKEKNFHFKIINILNFNSISKIIKEKKIDTIFHLAAILPQKNDLENPFSVFNINALGTLNLLGAAYNNKVKKFIYASTMSVYSEPPQYLPVDETHPTNPLTIYGVSKLTGELFCNAYSKAIDITILRYGGAYGEGQHKHNAVYRFIKQAQNNQPITIYGNGRQTTDFIHISDIVNGTILVMEKNKPGTYNLGSGEETSIKKLAKKIPEVLGVLMTEGSNKAMSLFNS